MYNERIRADIKNKNLYQLKYQFNKKLIKSRQELFKSQKNTIN